MKFFNVRFVLRILIAIFAVIYLIGAFFQRIDSDEWQQMVISVNVADGEALYVDVWDNHCPALTYILAIPLKLIASENHSVVRLMRVVMLLFFFLPSLLVSIAWCRQFFARPEAESAIFLLLSSFILFQKGMEIRSDIPLLLLWMLSLHLWFAGFQKDRPLYFLFSGMALGLGFAFNLKTLILGFSAGLMFITAAFYNRRMLLHMIPFGIGCTLGPIATYIALKSGGVFDAFWSSYVGENFDRPSRSLGEGYEVLADGGFIWAHLMLASLAYTLWMAIKRLLPPFAVILWPCAFFLVFQFLFLLPTVHHQSLLPALPPCAVLMVIAIHDAWKRIQSRMPNATTSNAIAVAALILLMFMCLKDFGLNDRLYMNAQIEYANTLQEIIPENEMVFTGFSQPLFRTQPTKYRSLVEHLRFGLQTGRLDINFPEVLASKDVRYVVFDKRIRDLDEETETFVRNNYIPTRIKELRAAGILRRPETNGEQSAQIHVAGEYWWRTTEENTTLTINGEAAPNPVSLADGEYLFAWNDAGPLVLCIETPENWLPEADPRRARN